MQDICLVKCAITCRTGGAAASPAALLKPRGGKELHTAWDRIHRSKVEHYFARLHRFLFVRYGYLKTKPPGAVRLITWGDRITRLAKLVESRKRRANEESICKCGSKKPAKTFSNTVFCFSVTARTVLPGISKFETFWELEISRKF
jgi:hypothetical protein